MFLPDAHPHTLRPTYAQYSSVAANYIAMIPEETVRGEQVASPAMQTMIDELAADGAAILDAPCGVGWNAIALAKAGRDFRVAISDGSEHMLKIARNNADAHLEPGINFIGSHQALLHELGNQKDWHEKFDMVLVPNVASELFGNMDITDYDAHIISSLQGVGTVLKKNGVVLIDSRDWRKTFENAAAITQRQHTHGTSYLTQYDWIFGATIDSVHTAHTRIWNNPLREGPPSENHIRFAGRTDEQLQALFEQAGFHILQQTSEVRGLNHEPFNVYALARK